MNGADFSDASVSVRSSKGCRFVNMPCSLLISRNRGADEIAREIDVISGDDESCCVRVGRAVLLFNDGGTISNDIIETDARQLYIEESKDRVYAVFRNASIIVFRGRELLRRTESGDGEPTHKETGL